jgi:hypothetical protein
MERRKELEVNNNCKEGKAVMEKKGCNNKNMMRKVREKEARDLFPLFLPFPFFQPTLWLP